MISSMTFTTNIPLKTNPHDLHPGLSSVFAAAVVNQNFRKMLLNEPARALKQGYLGKSFALSQEDASLLVSLNAKTLPDLAKQVVHTIGN
jgi:hypothetical protein